MNKEDFTIINGTGGKKDDKPIVWKSYGKGKPIRTLDPNTMKVVEAPNTISFGDFAFTATMSEEQLRNLLDRLKANPNIRITYNIFAEEEERRANAMEELREMFKDNSKIVVFDDSKRK